MTAKISQQRIVFPMRTGLIKTIPIKPYNLCESLIHSKGNWNWNLRTSCGVSLESSWWTPFTWQRQFFADWFWQSLNFEETEARSAVVSELLWNGLNCSQLVKNLRSQKCRHSVSHVKETHSVLTVRYVSLWFCSKPDTRKWVRLSAHKLQLWDR